MMKRSVSLLLVLLLALSLAPHAFAAGIDSFDPAQALAEQSVWAFIDTFGSLEVCGQMFYTPNDGVSASDVSEISDRYYYDPVEGVLTFVSEQETDAYYYLDYIDNLNYEGIYGSYVYDNRTDEIKTNVEAYDIMGLVDDWNNTMSHCDITGAALQYKEEKDGEYVFHYSQGNRDLTLYFDAATGWLHYTTEMIRNNDANTFIPLVYDPCGDPAPDQGYHAYFLGTQQENNAPQSAAGDGKLSFHTKDVYGNAVDSSILAGKKLILVNFWEPWCGWCLKEMPDMQRLYEKYKDQGLLFIGVYKRDEDTTDEEAQEEIQSMGITYPIIQDCPELQGLVNEGWPCTYAFDGNGKQIGDIIDGYKPEDAWEALIIQNLLG